MEPGFPFLCGRCNEDLTDKVLNRMNLWGSYEVTGNLFSLGKPGEPDSVTIHDCRVGAEV